MKKFLCTADSVDYLSVEIEAKSEQEAWEKFNDMLCDGLVPETGDGTIDNEGLIEIK